MSNAAIRFAACALALFALPTIETFASATVNYQGFLYNQFNSPAVGDKAIAGTFKPGFNPGTIACTYGDDFCNLSTAYYDKAVADGTILPIGNLVTVNGSGFFSGSGTTDAAPGTKIYLFGLPPFEHYYSALGTSSHSSFLVPASGGTTNIDAGLTNQFIFGDSKPGGMIYRGLPIPEPSTILLAMISLTPFACRRKRR